MSENTKSISDQIKEQLDREEKLRRKLEHGKKQRKKGQGGQVTETLVEVNVQRYAGWREHYPSPFYYIDQNERVFEVVRKKK